MDTPLPTTHAQAPSPAEGEGEGLPVLLAKAAALSAAIDGQASKLAAELGSQLAGRHGMEPMPRPDASSAPVDIDATALVAQAQGQMLAAIDRLRGLAEGLGVTPAPAAAGAPSDPLSALLDGLVGHSQAQLKAHMGLAAAEPSKPPTDIDLKAILSAAQAAHEKAQRAADDLLKGMGFDPANPIAGLAERLPHAPVASPPALPTGMPGGDLLGSMQGDMQRLQDVLRELAAKVQPPP